MDEVTKGKLMAAGKVAYGVGRGISAVLLATGHGLAGAFFKRHHMMAQAHRFGALGLKAASETVKEGMTEWERWAK